MISKQRLLEIIKAMVEQEGVTQIDAGGDIAGWDSLTHLSILVALDHELGGRAGAIDELAGCQSADELYRVLQAHAPLPA